MAEKYVELCFLIFSKQLKGPYAIFFREDKAGRVGHVVSSIPNLQHRPRDRLRLEILTYISEHGILGRQVAALLLKGLHIRDLCYIFYAEIPAPVDLGIRGQNGVDVEVPHMHIFGDRQVQREHGNGG